jgi:uncharacterized OB-fold protein
MTSDIVYTKPVPVPDEASRPWYEGARRHQLMLQRCGACGTAMAPVKPRCITCFAPSPAWVAAAGQGTLYTYTIVHQSYPGFADQVPYNIAVVELEEGVRVTANVVDCDNDQLRIGMALEVVFDDITDDVTLPRFRPAAL